MGEIREVLTQQGVGLGVGWGATCAGYNVKHADTVESDTVHRSQVRETNPLSLTP